MANYKKKIEMHMQKNILEKLNAFAGMSACAGIQNKPDEAVKMAINHYGNGDNPVRRPWLDYATGSGDKMKYFERKFLYSIGRAIKGSTPNITKERFRYDRSLGHEVSVGRYAEAGKLFGQGKWQSAHAALKLIADKMAENQKRAIDYVSFAPNKQSTVDKKGFSWPLVDTKKSYKSIKGWVE